MTNEILRYKQDQFAEMVAQLIQKAHEMGYEITLGERLAIDINLFKNEKPLRNAEDYAQLGFWWESIDGTWGGRRGEWEHFSLKHEGRK